MTPVAFSVTEVRVAATCPRISYFDFEHTRRHRLKSRSVTRLWKAGAEETACGGLFHNAVEAFNRRALDAPEVRATVEGESEPRTIERRLREFLNLQCVDLNALALRSVAQQEAFIRAVGIYMGELADIIGDARIRGKPTHRSSWTALWRPKATSRCDFPGWTKGGSGPYHRDPRLCVL